MQTDHLRAATAQSNVVRIARASIRREVEAGKTHITALIARPADAVGDVDIRRALGWAPLFGEAKINRLLVSTQVSETRTLADLTDHERLRLQIGLRELFPLIWARWQQMEREVTA